MTHVEIPSSPPTDSDKRDTVPVLKTKTKKKNFKKRSITPLGMLRRINCFGGQELVERVSVVECLDTQAKLNKELDEYLDNIAKEPTRKFRTHNNNKEKKAPPTTAD